MRFLAHPALAHLFTPEDAAQVSRLRGVLSREAIAAWRGGAGSIYDTGVWQRLGGLGMFRLGLDAEDGLSPRAAARATAMMADALAGDEMIELDLAFYVHGVVAAHTLIYNRDNAFARALLGPVLRGEIIMCTAYTDADPSAPATANPVEGGFVLNGSKWLSVNMPDADFAFGTFRAGDDRIAALLALDGTGIARKTLRQSGSGGLYSQGSVTLDNVFLPAGQVLAGGLRRLRAWNRAMSVSRLLNAVSALRALEGMIERLGGALAARPVAGRPFRDHPEFRAWMIGARAKAAVIENAVAAVIRDMADGRVDEPGIAGLKAIAVGDAVALATMARDFSGGAGTLADSEIGRITDALAHHKFSSGAEAALMALYAGSLSRRALLGCGVAA